MLIEKGDKFSIPAQVLEVAEISEGDMFFKANGKLIYIPKEAIINIGGKLIKKETCIYCEEYLSCYDHQIRRGKWIPVKHNRYFYIENNGAVIRSIWLGDNYDIKRAREKNIFMTESEALAHKIYHSIKIENYEQA